VESGTGTRAFLGFTPQAGKTGTNQSYRDAWFIGFTAHYVTGVWFGNDDFTEMKKVTGGLLPAQTWKEVMMQAEQTQVAAALPGVPLDERYARYAAEHSAKIEIVAEAPTGVEADGSAQPQVVSDASSSATEVIAPAKPRKAKASRTRQRVAATEEDVVIVKPRRSRDPVVEAISDLFGLFGDDGDRPAKRTKRQKRSDTLVLPETNTRKKKRYLFGNDD
jgi:penicillin-binding protein 1A